MEQALQAEKSKRVRRGPLLFCSLALYQVVLLIVFCGFLAWRLILDRRYRRGARERFGVVPRSATGAKVVWIHGVSVGEVKAADSLIHLLGERHPDLELVVSATTPTGFALAKDMYPHLRVILYPMDLGPCPAIALRRVAPICVLLMELEVWPNFLQAASNLGIPVAVINGRISEQSFKRYRMIRALLPQFNLIQIYCMQDEVYRTRLLELNVDRNLTEVTGNMKYDNVRTEGESEETIAVRDWLSPDGRLVLVCGSTHGDEEEWLATAANDVRSDLGIAMRIVVAPRHPERAPSVREGLAARGWTCSMWSSHMGGRRPLADNEILIVDTIGHLETFYGACDLAFIGGSLVPRGGQNMVEAAAMGKAVVFGPHVSNFRRDVQLLLEAHAACQVSDLEDLRAKLKTLCGDDQLRQKLGERAVGLIRGNQGSTERTLEKLQPLLGAS